MSTSIDVEIKDMEAPGTHCTCLITCPLDCKGACGCEFVLGYGMIF